MAGGGTRTVMFNDLVGSTTLLTELGPERFEELLAEHDCLVATAIEDNGGELVKHTGDGVMAVFAGAADGLGAAVTIQQLVDHRNRRAPVPLDVRVGLSVGDVSSKEGDYFGPAPVEARRLCDAARGGQILAAAVIGVLAGARGGHTLSPVGELELKGLPPLATVEVLWEPIGPAARVRVPEALASHGDAPLVGRAAALDQLVGEWERASAGERRLVVISGEAGIGKTRLAGELAGRVAADLGTVLLGRGDEQLVAPFAPVIEMLHQLITATPDPELRTWIGDRGQRLTRLVPELSARVDVVDSRLGLDAASERLRMFEAIGHLLDAAAGDAPILAVLDDAQWADRTSLLLVRYLLQRPAPAALLLLLTVREYERSPALDDAVRELSRTVPVATVRLEGISEAAVDEYLSHSQALVQPGERSTLVATLCQRTGGNPLFLREVVRDITDRPLSSVPDGVKDVLRRRLTALSPGARQVLAEASVIGFEFRAEVLEALGTPEPVLLGALDEAVLAGILRETAAGSDGFEFSHALVRDEVYSSLTRLRRARVHHAIAHAIIGLETPGQNAADIASHLLATGAVEDRRAALGYLRKGAEDAIAVCAYEQATDLLEQAVAIAEEAGLDPGVRAELRIALGDAAAGAGEVGRCDEQLREAGRLADKAQRPDLLGAAALGAGSIGFGGGYYLLRTDPELFAMLEIAEERTRGERSLLRVRLVTRLSLELRYHFQSPGRRADLVHEAITLANELHDPRATLQALHGELALATSDNPAERHEKLDRMLQLADALGDPVELLLVRYDRIHGCFEAGDLAGVESELAASEQLLASFAHPFHLAELRRLRNVLALVTGRFDDVTPPDPLDERGFGSFAAAIQQAMLVWMRGEALAPFVEIAKDHAAKYPETPAWRVGAAVLMAETGQLDSAREQLELLASSDGPFDLPHDDTWTTSMCLLAVACRRIGDAVTAARIAELLDGRHEVLAFLFPSLCLGSTRLYLAIARAAAGDLDAALDDFERAEAVNLASGARPFVAFGRLEHAATLLERCGAGDQDRAVGLLETAAPEAVVLGMRAVAVRASSLREP